MGSPFVRKLLNRRHGTSAAAPWATLATALRAQRAARIPEAAEPPAAWL